MLSLAMVGAARRDGAGRVRESSGGGCILKVMTTRPAGSPRYSAGSPFSARPAQPIEQFAVLDRVTHDKFGLGRVVAEEAAAVIVDFGTQRVRIASPFRRLTKL